MSFQVTHMADPFPLIRVLLIEDSPGDALLIKNRLDAASDFRFKVEHAERMDEAKQLILTRSFDVVLLDLSLPDSFGLATVETLKEADPDLPIVVMTGLPDLPLQQAAIDAGIQEFVRKGEDFRPTLEDTLRHAIQRQSLVVENQQTARALRRSEESIRALLESCPIAVFVERDGLMAYMNAAAIEIVGNRNEQQVGERFLDVFDPADRAAMSDLLDRVIAERNPVEFPNLRLRSRGSAGRIVDATTLPIDFEGRPAILTVARDVTDQRNADAKAILADRVIASSLLAAGLAHEINNPLTYVLADSQILIHETTEIVEKLRAAASGSAPLAPDAAAKLANQLEELIDLMGDCRDGANRIRCVMDNLKILSGQEDGPDQAIDVVSVFRSAVSMLSQEIEEKSRLIEDYHSAPPVRANPGRLGQVFVNLLTNATHALSDISRQGELRVSSWTDNEGFAVIEVRDNGCGMSAAELNHAFDPFFTTKSPAGGRGLGLSISHKIIEDYGGEITVVSTLDQGTNFRVRLPYDGASDRIHVWRQNPTGSRRTTSNTLAEELL